MAHNLATSSAYHPPALTRECSRNTMIEDSPQVSVRRAPPQKLQERPEVVSPMSDDFPTPKGNTSYVPLKTVVESPASSDTQSDADSVWSKRSSKSDFDELYDISESEVDDLPFKLSSSVKKRVNPGRPTRYPSLVIPSPSEWPSIDKLRSTTALSPPTQIILSPAALSKIQQRSLRVPSSSTAPSLDGSLTSEELASSTCPSTPDLQQHADGNEWEPPTQLDPSALFLLRHISLEDDHDEVEVVIEVSEEARAEMREIVESPPLTSRLLGIDTKNLALSKDACNSEADDELSALSVPSPGGFFASLDSSVRRTWSNSSPGPTTGVATSFYSVPFRKERESVLTTSTAASFYGVPWRSSSGETVEQTISIASPKSDQHPVTARRIGFSPTEVITEVDEVDESYNATLEESAAVNMSRTQLWLHAQTDYMKAVCEDDNVVESFKLLEDAVPKTPDITSPNLSNSSPSKKSVRFADAGGQAGGGFSAEPAKRISPIHDGTFWQGWRHAKRSQRARDVFEHRQARAEAEHVRRTSCAKDHVQQLQGKYEITTADRPSPARPVSSLLPATTEDEMKEIIAQAERERQALLQIQSSAWALSAQKEVNGGRLLTSPIVASFKVRSDVQMLDIAGQAHCGWAWTVAAEHPEAVVYTTVFSDAEAHVAESSLEGPSNHFVVAAPNIWELPFEDNTFDVVSARSLYTYLKTTWPKGQSADEWDLTLRECLRVIKPGGYFEFDLVDAELVHADQVGQALGVEFAFNLKTRGYDPSAGKSFLPRLKRAGFGDIKRAWMVLPVADVLPKWTDTGKTPNSGSSAATITPGAKRDDYFGPEAAERVISPDGSVKYYEAPVTGSTRDVRAMTGLVGARLWEQWMLKLNNEMGRSEARCLEGVAKALEEGGKGNAAWRDLANMLFFSFFKTLVNHEVTVELKNDISIRGTLKSVDQYLNIKLDDISVVEEMKYPHLSSVKNVFIRGSVVRYVHLPAAAVDTPLLEDATRREASQAVAKAKQG
ncbi:hypothetical protein LTR91_007302 [Friedmanniomyces endolithicus]|uniref:Sm domain-containing protein n=1 Tax=Friedmanniomyces endolithicus TaxID=329885 RepID=A0AAN6KQD9_9PEZI|nr:hypothetical protein LTR59_003911 [Friedmanniomyces endolithicus]KAK0848905.1 hypothetical protein LTR03_005470 [Friedmanniomyces endolithicus]KAK0995403.1 hypothetical protein LTR91_007302 [Friedmanniomyces endolithicus]KAK1046667.1 hypothetical protein LTS16_005697 [Friedmanniomyces endolithicus]